MRDRAIIKDRLSQYSALWLGAFLLVLILAAGASLVARFDLIAVADLVLPVAFLLLGAAMMGGVGLTAVSRARLATKVLVAALALLLVLPLLWAPVLAVLAVAAIGGAVIEYSTAYAHFRIAVSQLIYPIVSLFSEGALASTIWAGFQMVASVVGFLASALQVWKTIKAFWTGDDADADAEAA